MFLEAYVFDEMEVGGEYGIGGLLVEDSDEQGHYALDDECVALSLEVDGALGGEVCLKPDATLASVDEVAFSLVF